MKNKRDKMNPAKMYLAFFVFLFFMPQLLSAANLIVEQQRSYNVELGKYNLIKNELDRLETTIHTSKKDVRVFKAESTEAGKKLQYIQDVDRKDPNLGLRREVQAAVEVNLHAYNQHKSEKDRLKKLQAKFNVLNTRRKDTIILLNSISNEIKRSNGQMVAAEVEKRIGKLKKTSLVEGYAEAGCGEEEPARKCQIRALRSAERDASEKGSIVIVTAVSHIENFQLTKDQVKTEVQAQLSNIEIIKKGWMGDSTYQYRIRAQVTPIIGAALTEQIKISITQELGVSAPALLSYDSNVAPVALTISDETFKSSFLSVGNGSLADDSFDAMDGETGHVPGKFELENENGQKKKQVVISGVVKPGREKSWYALVGGGLAIGKYGKGPAVELGAYLPVRKTTLFGVNVLFSKAGRYDYNSIDQGSQRLNFFVGNLGFFGEGFFYRADVGLILDHVAAEYESYGYEIGYRLGLGYSLPLSQSTILYSLDFTRVTGLSDDANTFIINVSILW